LSLKVSYSYSRCVVACPTLSSPYRNAKHFVTTITTVSGDNVTVPLPSDFTYSSQCSGHGRCLSLRDAASGFDGMNLIRPPTIYSSWDANKIQGCICDSGWTGYDCSRKSCPVGRDPLDPNLAYDKDETFYLQCQASDGYFSLLVNGYLTDPIPYDADPTFLKKVLQSLPDVGKVLVTISSSVHEGQSTASICGSSDVVTSNIRFLSHVGSRPPIRVFRNVSSTRQWPSAGSSPLSLSGSLPILQMKTIYSLICPSCVDCTGNIYFKYLTSVSSPIDVTSLSAADLVYNAIYSLTDLKSSNWDNLHFTVENTGSTDRICNSGDSTTITLNIFSDYGNIGELSIIDASFNSGNISFTNNKGNGTLYECSNQGICDHNSGTCSCNQLQIDGHWFYRAISSDGKQNFGNRGDCGALDPPLSTCFISNVDVCSNHGKCSNETNTCSCYSGWSGLTCSLRSCPKVIKYLILSSNLILCEGPAFFDEPLFGSYAHQLAECSNVGHCDRQSGYCQCRSGFSGTACQIRDCPTSPTGITLKIIQILFAT
jgi:hypothetical protein